MLEDVAADDDIVVTVADCIELLGRVEIDAKEVIHRRIVLGVVVPAAAVQAMIDAARKVLLRQRRAMIPAADVEHPRARHGQLPPHGVEAMRKLEPLPQPAENASAGAL